MVRGSELTDFQRGMVIGCHISNLSVREAATRLNIPKSNVEDVIKRWKTKGDTKPKKRSGRKCKITERGRRALKRIAYSSRMSSAENITTQLQEVTGTTLSIPTIRRGLHSLGFHGRAAAHKPHISGINAKHRLEWCQVRRSWTTEQWKNILWSDESRYTLYRSDGRIWVWRLPGERFLQDCIIPTNKFGGGGLMVWGCFSWFGLGPLFVVPGTMKAVNYLNILDNFALPTLWQYFGNSPCHYQHDNAKCHTAGVIQDWFEDNHVKKLEWPAQSPDLNPIEHLWDELERRIRLRPIRPSSIPTLALALQEEWRRIPPEIYQKLVDSMPRRIEAVIKSKGGPTNY